MLVVCVFPIVFQGYDDAKGYGDYGDYGYGLYQNEEVRCWQHSTCRENITYKTPGNDFVTKTKKQTLSFILKMKNSRETYRK